MRRYVVYYKYFIVSVEIMYKHASGAEKRKKRKILEEIHNRLPKITTFFTDTNSTSSQLQNDINQEITHGSELTHHEIIPEDTASGPENEIDVETEIKNQEMMNEEEQEPPQPPIATILKISQWSEEMICKESFIENILINSPKSDAIENTAKVYKDGERIYSRMLKESDFFRIVQNGKREKREWLIYDSSVKAVFCYPCKLFSKENNPSLLTTGYSDWKNLTRTLKSHEESKVHIRSMVTFAHRTSLVGTIDMKLKNEIQNEELYWRKVLERILATVNFLSRQGLPFRGSDENIGSRFKGNYLSCLVYLANFDDFLAEHLRRFGNKGKGSVSYLSHHICDEFIEIIRDRMLSTFSGEIKAAKYFGIIVDSTPDVSHCDQLSLILRYVHEGQITERFVGFIKLENHTADCLQEAVLSKLEQLSLSIQNCRGQSYDNAANMSGKYNGLQAKIRILSPTAIYVPCTNHSLNLVLNFACESSLEVTNYFNIVQGIYNFFSSSTHRWQKLAQKVNPTPKRLSDTRWSARHDSVHALFVNYKSIIDVLSTFVNDESEKPISKSEASTLLKNIENFEFVLLTIIWSKILERINAVNLALENPKLNLCQGVHLLKSLISFIDKFRNSFDEMESLAQLMSADFNYTYRDETKRKRKRKLFADETKENEVLLTGRDNFKINVFFCNLRLLES